MQPDIDEIGGDVLEIGPLDRIGEDQGDAVAAQQRDETRRLEAGMTDLEGVAQGMVAGAIDPAPPGEPMIVPRREMRASFKSRGSMARNASSRSSSKLKLGGSCHRTGPSFFSRRSTPEAKKLASGVSIPRSFFIWVMKRPPLTAKTKSFGTASLHVANDSGRCKA